MNKRQFVQHRKGAWIRFERLVDRLDRIGFSRMRPKEVSEFSTLLRELSNDLATIRSRGWGRRLESYLNHLVARGHNSFYRAPSGNLSEFIRFVASGYPRLFRKNVGYFFVAATLFFVPLAVTWAVVQAEPSLASRILPAEQLERYEQMYDRDPDDASRGRFGELRAAMGGFYVYNNVGIALRAFAGGILMGAFTVYVLLSNGISIGATSGYLIAMGHGKAFTSFVVSHGSFELTAIAVAGGAGLMLGRSLVHTGQRTRLESLKVRGLEAVQIAAGAAVMLLVAAVIEAFWSPSGVPSVLKYIVGAALWGLVFMYLFLAGRGE